nr:hypothetical protein [Candidatus Babeliales bacterium]
TNDLEEARKFLKAGGDIEALNGYSYTPLLAQRKNPQMQLFLIKMGANVNAKSFFNYSALHLTDNPKITKLLIGAGADVNAKNMNNRSPLHLTDNPEIAKLLIGAGADLNAQNNLNHTPLEEQINPEIAKLLILAGATIQDIQKIPTKDNDLVKNALKYVSHLADNDTIKKFYNNKRLFDLALKKHYQDYLDGSPQVLEEVLLNPSFSDHFKSNFKPEFIEKVRENKELREKLEREKERAIYREQLKPDNLLYSKQTKKEYGL